MSGLEIFGAIGAAVTLIELAKKCSARLEKGRNTHRGIATLQKRVDLLTKTIGSVFDILEDIRRQCDGHTPATAAENTVWQHTGSVLKLCHQNLLKLDNQLENLLQKGSKSPSAIPPDITRRAEDMQAHIQALDMLEGLFILILQRRLAASQTSIHANIRDIQISQDDKFQSILEGIKNISDQFLEHQGAYHSRSSSVQSKQTLVDTEDKADTLSIHLNNIMSAATDVQASSLDPQISPLRSSGQDSSLVGASSTSAPFDAGPLRSDSVTEITHIEPLRELAQRFKAQAELDFRHTNFEDALYHQSESIKCFKELHDEYEVPFDTYHDMRMKLREIYEEVGEFGEARRILEENSNKPLAYSPGLRNKDIVSDAEENLEHKANNSHDMAHLFFKQFNKGKDVLDRSPEGQSSAWRHLREAESHAKRAFRIRREICGKHHESCKQTALLLRDIYTSFPDKSIYAETYSDLYLLDDEHRQNPLLTLPSATNSSRSRSLAPSTHSSLAEAVRDHASQFDDVVAMMSRASLKELEETIGGKSVTMLAMDCKICKQSERCGLIVDKLLRREVNRDAHLVYAIKIRSIPYCELMLDHGAKINRLDVNRLTPLMHAIRRSSVEMVEYLLARDADVNIVGDRGLTALHLAMNTRNEDIVKHLLKANSLELDIKDASGLTALHYCAKQDNIAFAKRLVRAGADLNIKDESGSDRTPLWIAVKEDKWRLAKALLKLGATIDADDVRQARSRDMRNLLREYQTPDPG